MKISQEIIKSLVRVARDHGVAEDIDAADGRKLKAFYLNDVTITFIFENGKPALYGVSFEALGREFTILNNFNVYTPLPNEDNTDEEVYELEDEGIVKHLEKFLLWRIEAVELFDL